MKGMKRYIVCLLTLAVLLGSGTYAKAAGGNVTYSGDAGQFIFQPGSDKSVTDLFVQFKDVMPGDNLSQTIAVRNDASDKVDVKIYLRSLGAHEDSVDFLSQLTLDVTAGESELFSAPADQKAQLGDWVLLGELRSGGKVELTVALQVPVTLDSRFMDATGYLDWQFMVEEFPVDRPDQPDDPDTPIDPDKPDDPEKPDESDQPDKPDKPDVPKTGDSVNIGLFMGLFVNSGAILIVLLWLLFKKRKKDTE